MTYGDTALQFEVVFYVTKPDFNIYADAQQKINLTIIECLRAMKVDFTAPARTIVYLENASALTQTQAGDQSLRT